MAEKEQNFPEEVLQRFADSEYADERRIAAEHGVGLEKLVNDENWLVRCSVAAQGYGLDVLAGDEHYLVRATVADQGHALESLVNDEDEVVRASVARHGYGLDVLVRDESEVVRSVMTELGYGLDILVADEMSFIRAEVAEQGFGLDKLAMDENLYVREHALNKAAEMVPDVDHSDPEKLIAAWSVAYPDKCALVERQMPKNTGRFRQMLVDVANRLSDRVQRQAAEKDKGDSRSARAAEKIAGAAKQMSDATDRATAAIDEKFGRLTDYLEQIDDKLESKFEKRAPGELKNAAGRPVAKAPEAATPSGDMRACSASAAARGVEAQAHEVKRQK